MILLSDSKSNQNWSKIYVRLSDNIFRDFRVALALTNETAQDVLARAVSEYIASVTLPDDLGVGKSQQ